MPSLSADLAVSLLAALLWSAIDTARLGAVSHALAFPALLGSSALLLGVALVSVRRSRPSSDGLRAIVAGAAIASLPLALLAAALQRLTHHRALGGVTFAFAAVVVVAFAIALAWRLVVVVRRGGRAATVARALLVVACIVSTTAVVVFWLAGSRSEQAAPLMPGMLDALIGASLLALGAIVAGRFERSPSPLFGVTWLCVVLSGVAVAVSQPALRAKLAAGAPVAFVIGAGCGG